MLLASIAALLLSSIASHALAVEPISYAVNARIHVDDGVLVGAMHTEVWAGEGEREIHLWLYPDRLAIPPSEMDEISGRWIFPGEVSEGGISVTDVRVNDAAVTPRVARAPVGRARGRDFAGADLVVPIEPGPRRPIAIRARFVLRLPERFGRVGRVGDRLTLVAPWYPLVVDGDAWRFDVPHRVRVETTDGELELLVGEHRVRSGETTEVRGAFAPIVGAPHLYERRTRVSGRDLVVIGASPFYSDPGRDAEGIDALSDLVRVDVPELVAGDLREVLATVYQAEVPRRRGPVTVVLVPFRTELAGTAPGIVVASDRIYEIFPIHETREFHRRAFRRVLFRHLVEPVTDLRDPPLDRNWADDLRAVLLTDVDDARRHGGAQTPADLVGFASFHPSVDQLLYAPQVEFVEIYFGVIDEPDPFRDDPARARAPLPRGRRLLESARDYLSDDAFLAFTRALLAGEVSAREALGQADPAALDRLPIWLDAPNRPVNYALGEIRSEPDPDGGFVHRITVHRFGRERPEPVEVQVEDDDGNVVTGEWDGRGRSGVVVVHTPADLDDVRIDPRERLPQSPALASGHPRGDDATTLPWRLPLLRGFGLSVSFTQAEVYGFVDFVLRRKYDLEHGIGLTLSHLSSTTGGTLRYFHGLGPKRHTNARIGQVSIGLDFDRVREGFVELGTGGYRLSLLGTALIDTRQYFVDPREGASIVGSARVGGVYRDDDTFGITASVTVRGSYTLGLGMRNALVLVGDVGWTFGDALPGELQQLGGRYQLRGFETTELVGRGGAYLVAEHRWTPFADLAWNILHLAWLREIQLAVWVGGGVVVDSLASNAAGEVVNVGLGGGVEAGGGVRFHFTYAGVQPGVLSVDIGVPLTRDPDRIGLDGQLGSDRSPVAVYASFDQYF